MGEFRISGFGDLGAEGSSLRVDQLAALARLVADSTVGDVTSPDETIVTAVAVKHASLLSERITPPATPLEQASVAKVAVARVMVEHTRVAHEVGERI